MTDQPNDKIVILGAGITGLTLAKELSKVYHDRVIVIEREGFLGGLTSTLLRDGINFDLGSHRLHKDMSPAIISYIEAALGEHLLKQPRNGRLYFQSRWLKYPPRIIDLLKSLPPLKIIHFFLAYLQRLITPLKGKKENFETVMVNRVGRAIYEALYKEYAIKLWGIAPEKLSQDAARRRRVVFRHRALVKNIFKEEYFWYPRYGIGDIAKKLEEAVVNNKGIIKKSAEATAVSLDNNHKVSGITIRNQNQQDEVIRTSLLLSTIHMEDLYTLTFNKEKPKAHLEWRAMRLLYIVLDKKIEDNCETYYFPETSFILGRVSEISKYSPYLNPSTKGTMLTIEVPCFEGDKIWFMQEQDFLTLCLQDLIRAGILSEADKVINHFSISLKKTHPIYRIGWKKEFFLLYNRLNNIENLFTIGRGGLFLHCNIDHCIMQGLELASLIIAGSSNNKEFWDRKVSDFSSFIARD